MSGEQISGGGFSGRLSTGMPPRTRPNLGGEGVEVGVVDCRFVPRRHAYLPLIPTLLTNAPSRHSQPENIPRRKNCQRKNVERWRMKTWVNGINCSELRLVSESRDTNTSCTGLHLGRSNTSVSNLVSRCSKLVDSRSEATRNSS